MLTQIDGLTQYETLLDGANIIVGGEGEKFHPTISFSKWESEAWMDIVFPCTVVNEVETFVDGVLSFEVAGMTHKYYVDLNGNLEYEIIVPSKPAQNNVDIAIDFSPNLIFEFQDTLENDYYNDPELQVLFPTLEDFLSAATRPEEAINSYAIYAPKDGIELSQRKLCHIYRPKVTDALNDYIYADLTIDPVLKIMSIVIDRTWLKNATYPVIIDPTFGYSSAGASSFGSNTVRLASFAQTPASDGTTTTFHVAVAAVDGVSQGLKLGIYETTGDYAPASDHSPRNQNLVEQVSLTASVSDDVQTAAGGSAITASTYYSLAFIPESSNTKIKYDTGGAAGQGCYQTSLTYGSELASNWGNGASYNNWIVSIWVDYSSGGGGGVPPQGVTMPVFGDMHGLIFGGQVIN